MKLRLLPWVMQMWAMPLYMTPFLHFSCFELRADQVETQSGDRYVGKVLSVNADTLVLQSEVLGTVRLPRAKVAQIILGTNAPAVSPVLPVSALPHPTAAGLANSNLDFSATLPQLGASSNLIQQVQAQFLSGAGPEANNKFQELLGGYLTGKLTVSDIRAQAKSAADQMRAARKDLGEDADSTIDGYLAILDDFLKETAPPPTSNTNNSAPPVKSKPPVKEE